MYLQVQTLNPEWWLRGGLQTCRVLRASMKEAAYVKVANGVLTKLTHAFFNIKDTRLSQKVMEDAGRRVGGARIVLLDQILPHAASARTDYLRVEAATLAATLLRQVSLPLVILYSMLFRTE